MQKLRKEILFLLRQLKMEVLAVALAKMSFGNHLGAEISADDKVLLEKNLASLVIESTGNIENILIKEIGAVNSSNILK